MNPIFITHTSAIVPQHYTPEVSFGAVQRDINASFRTIEPDYSAIIPPLQLRRMSRVLRMGVYTGMDCIRQSGISSPDGIITGTAKGSMTDTEKFVKELKEYDEQALNPTPFILSTYNAINGAIALQTQATGYNQTFVHRGSSLEASLYDAQLRLNNEKENKNYLVGCFEENTEEFFLVKNKIGYWKKDRDATKPLWEQEHTTGTIAGEGSAFFMISNKPGKMLAAINSITTTFRTTTDEIPGLIFKALDKIGWKADDIDLIILGKNGDSNDEAHYNQALSCLHSDIPVMVFKNLCGEYETSGGFALWLLCQMLKGIPMLEEIWYYKDRTNYNPKKIIYYNHYRGINHNLILLST